MAIQIDAEELLSLGEATQRLPRRRKGRRPHLATLYRWARRGLRGVRLETIQVGGTLCTSREALQRFFERLTARNSSPESIPASKTRVLARTDVELDRLGF